MDTTRSIAASFKHFLAGTALSRISGFARDAAMAFYFGSAPEVASFMVAYRFANLFRRLLGEGNLQAGFVPHFETLRGRHPLSAFAFYRDTLFSLAATIGLALVCIEAILGWSAQHVNGSWREMIFYSMRMAPGLLFICLASLNTALLQCQKRYFASAFAPVLFNAVWIVSAVLVCRKPATEAVLSLSAAITLAFAAQWAATAIRVQREVRAYLDWRTWLRPCFYSPEWKKLVKSMVFGIVGVGAMQVNSTLDALFARFSDPSGPAYLWYAIRVQQLPLALFGVALAGALLPPLSRAMQENALGRYREQLGSALRQAALFMIPCSFGLFVLGASGLNLLYGRGAFTPDAICQTLFCLWAYSLGLVPAVFVLLLATGFYANKKYGAPTLASLVSMGAHCCLNLLLIFGLHWGAVSVALATSFSSWLNFAILARLRPIDRSCWLEWIKIVFASAAAGGVALACGRVLGDGTLDICCGCSVTFARSFFEQFVLFISMGACFLVVYAGIAALCGWVRMPARVNE